MSPSDLGGQNRSLWMQLRRDGSRCISYLLFSQMYLNGQAVVLSCFVHGQSLFWLFIIHPVPIVKCFVCYPWVTESKKKVHKGLWLGMWVYSLHGHSILQCVFLVHIGNFKFLFLVIVNYQAVIPQYHASKEYLTCCGFCPCCDVFLSEMF